ncbi:SDR family oxidoreductase [Mycolicibacterium sp.]|uniref:SDR family NAD(P)-dependent oxidoreductase n=1 Tax=Mycolicibacterium sp. TaxID=2320850 RepID=UPI001A2FCF8C|nr:SDR family oxidoreductase [Mycolicibacterium sp.]MBJ7341214.1 SDR family oxidoreductase [Mycolicibacterium sp.]
MTDARIDAGALTGRAVIVTGAAQGVGKGIAGALLQRGASVLLVDNKTEMLAATIDEFSSEGWTFEFLVADLRDRDSPGDIIGAALRNFGKVDGLVNDAIATNEPKALVDITSDDYDLGSGSGTGGQSQFSAYGAAKEAIRGMSKAAALEWGADNIRVNVICPFADSPGVRFWQDVAPKEFDRALRGVPLHRVGRTREDIGAVVAFLIGDDGGFITGQTIMVDGGMGVFR